MNERYWREREREKERERDFFGPLLELGRGCVFLSREVKMGSL